MPRLFRFLLLVPALLVLAGSARTASPHPVVPGFERFHSAKPDAGGGQLLLTELACVNCHASSDKSLAGKPAPVLDTVGSRARAAWLRKYLSNPHAVKAGSTMPHLLAEGADREEKIEALVHLLASTGGVRHERVLPKNIGAGKQLYERVGCVACHGSRKANGEADKVLSTHVPLGDLPAKYTIPGLASFLQDPLHSRPAGRMPRLPLNANEAKQLATFLLQSIKVDLAGGKGTSNYAYYEGGWQKLPDFSKLKPRATGKAQGFDVQVARRESNYGIKFTGVIRLDQDGVYNFRLTSDDGSQLFIDDKLIVDNDGIHAPVTKTGRANLKKGIRKITLTFFQGGGGAEVSAKISGPGLGEMDLGDLIATSEDDLLKRPAPKVEGEQPLVIKPELVKKGIGYFSSLGCASCHDLKLNGKAIASSLKAPELAKLDASKGCLSAKPANGTPRYDLSDAQKKAIVARLKTQATPETAKERIARTMQTFNCVACHVRDKVGGPQEEINKLFLTTQPEMGDEGRLPPPLDGVGAKLNPDYLKKILDQGVHDRPYMHTRMPGFGSQNVGHLVDDFASLDKLPVIRPVRYSLTLGRVKAEGRKLTGAPALACIKCHTFNGQKAEGVQGIDMGKLTQRLRRDWFHAYLADPQSIRPGTRMPASFVKGKSVLPDILDGTAEQQIEAMWLYLGDGIRARLPVGVGPSYIPLMPTESAIIYRNFIAGAGPRGIAVGYPEKAHLAFDANEMRLAMVWQGLFIDAARHWTDRGVGFQGPLGDNVLNLPSGPTFALLDKPDSSWPGNARSAGQRFKGYKLSKDDRPTFLYSVGDVSVEDFPNAVVVGKEPAFKRSFTLKTAKDVDNLYYRVAVGNKIEVDKDGWHIVTDDNTKYRMKVTSTAGKARVRKSGGKDELVMPVVFRDGKATVTVELVW